MLQTTPFPNHWEKTAATATDDIFKIIFHKRWRKFKGFPQKMQIFVILN